MKKNRIPRKSNKKAQLEHKLVSIILIVITFVIIVGVVQRGFTKFKGKDSEIICQESIAARAAVAIQAGDAELKTFPLLCQTLDKDISGETEEVKEQLARSMARCWWMFGEGRYDDLSGGVDPLRVVGFESADNACFLCYSLVVPRESLTESAISKRDMLRYVSDTPYPQVVDKTYLEYIQTYGGPGNVLVGSDISGGEAYGIVFVAKGATGGGPFLTLQTAVQNALTELGLYSNEVNTATSTIVLDRLSTINQQYRCESDIAGR